MTPEPPISRCNICGQPIEDRGYKHTQCRYCGQVSNLCCDPEAVCVVSESSASDLKSGTLPR